MPEETKKTRTRVAAEKPWSLVPYVLEKLLGAVESMTQGFSDTVTRTAEDLIDHGVQKLFWLLLLLMGIVFVLSGGAEVLSQVLQLPGSGQMIIGVFSLLVTSILILISRKR